MIVQCATFSKSMNPRNIDKSVSDIRIRFPFENSFWISVSGCKLTILPDIQPVNWIVIIPAVERPSLLAPWVTRLLSQWVLHWWQPNGSTTRELFACTHPLTPSTSLDKSQVPFFKQMKTMATTEKSLLHAPYLIYLEIYLNRHNILPVLAGTVPV